MSLYKDLKDIEPFTLSYHWDSDGIYSASILNDIFKVKESICARRFNEYDTQVSVDLGAPLNPNYEGVIIDHHPDYYKTSKAYTLYWDNQPTVLILYTLLKEHIKHTWKIIGGLVGDVAFDLCPSEIIEKNKLLLNRKIGYVKGNIISEYPIYYSLSSNVNALSKIGYPDEALEIVNKATNPYDIIYDSQMLDARLELYNEVSNILKEIRIEILYDKYLMALFESSNEKMKVSSEIANKLRNMVKDKYTVIAINLKNLGCSIRGNYTLYLISKLRNKGLRCGGHPQAGGVVLNNEKDLETLYSVIFSLE